MEILKSTKSDVPREERRAAELAVAALQLHLTDPETDDSLKPFVTETLK